METKIIIERNGRKIKIPVTLDDEYITRIYNEACGNPELTGWEKPNIGETYYFGNALCQVQNTCLSEDINSKMQLEVLHKAGNCYTDEKLANNLVRAENLIRQLHRFSVEHRTKPIDYFKGGYTITYNYMDSCIEAAATDAYLALGDILFEDEEVAQEAITEFREELLWYFTEMKDTI